MQTSLPQSSIHQNTPFFSLIRHPVKFRLYLLKNLPSAYFSGLSVIKADAEHCQVAVPFRWFTKNPFRSTYFACLSMAAELSTGVLAMAQVYKRQPAVSMLVVNMQAKFYKKAIGKTVFECKDGAAIAAAITVATESGKSEAVQAHSIGRSSTGELVAEFWFTWSFKSKSTTAKKGSA